MTEAVDHHIPVSSIARRLEAHRDEMRREYAATPWWRWKRRLMLDGAIAAYSYELEQLLAITGSWQPVWNRISRRRP